MRKYFRLIAVILIILIPGTTFAQNVKVVVDGIMTEYDPSATYHNAIIYSPYKNTFESLGSTDVKYNDSIITGTINGKKLVFKINSSEVIVDNESIVLSGPVIMLNKYPMLPIVDLCNLVGREAKYTELFETLVIKEKEEAIIIKNTTLNIEFDTNMSFEDTRTLLGKPDNIESSFIETTYTFNTNSSNEIKLIVADGKIIDLTFGRNWTLIDIEEIRRMEERREKNNGSPVRSKSRAKTDNLPKISNVLPLLK